MANRLIAALVATAVAVALISFSAAQAAWFIFGDGFKLEGQIKYLKSRIVDPVSGGSLTIPKQGEPFFIDDGVRLIYFSPNQLREAIDPNITKSERIELKQPSPFGQVSMPMSFTIKEVGEWSLKLERELKMDLGGKVVPFTQRITSITPEAIKVESAIYKSATFYKTEEFDPVILRELVITQLGKTTSKLSGDAKKKKALEDRYTVYRLLLQGGHTDQAEKELKGILADNAAEKSNVEPLLDNIKRIRALLFVDALESANKAGLYGEVERKLAQYNKEKLDDLVDQKSQLVVQSIKEQIDTGKAKVGEAERLLKAFAPIVAPSKKELFGVAAASILEELNADTVGRLETFVNIAGDYERAFKNKRKPEQPPDEVMALALTGWIRGSNAAEANAEIAAKHWELRQLLLKYLQSGDPQWISKVKAYVSVEEAMQIIRLLPPVYAEKIDPKKLTLEMQANGQNYHVRLPAGYHHGRAWPVMVVLHHSQEKPAEAAGRWADLAGQHGYILAAPAWSKGPKAVFGFNGVDHLAVLETIKDLRLRFNVDSDRIYLYGGEQGGNMAFDVACGHPDQFAGVITMAATPQFFINKCWSNAQYLPFYVINGELANTGARYTQTLFKDYWIKSNFPAIYVEYKGRPAEWFGGEQRIIVDWMNRKRRANPLKGVGSDGLEFKTQRNSDRQFYWLSADGVQPNRVNSALEWNQSLKPATLTARIIAASNEIQVKAMGVVGPVTVWFGPKLVNYGEKVKLRINDRTAGTLMIVPTLDVLLPALYQTGDRERMVFARVDLNP